MKLPEDLIKATDYSKAKDREIKEFEYVNGKYIHHYVLGGENELKPQEIVDCLNAIATIDCDLQTAYAYIQGQKDKVADLEAKLAESEKSKEINIKERDKICIEMAADYNKQIYELKQQLAEEDKEIEYYKTLLKRQCDECKHNRDKILFAVEQLEKVKNEIGGKIDTFIDGYGDRCIEDVDLEFFIDNQIKSIKGEK